MGTPIRTCYISAPAGSNLEVLRLALSTRNIEVVVPGDVSDGTNLQNQITSIISRVDLVIGVLTTERRSSWVLFELGLAWANKRSIMLISSPKNDFVPSNLQRFLVLRASLKNSEAIEFALDQFLAAPLVNKRIDTPRRSTEITADPMFQTTAQDALNAISHGDGRLLEQLLAKVLRLSGVEIVSEFEIGDRRRADMAIWADSLDLIVGNPILVEVKLRLHSSAEAKRMASVFADQVLSAGTQWGLLLYGQGSPTIEKSLSWLPPRILAIDIPTLLSRMQSRSFSDVIKDLRNQRVHGRYP